jgi:hypothetical protein
MVVLLKQAIRTCIRGTYDVYEIGNNTMITIDGTSVLTAKSKPKDHICFCF